MRIQDGYKIVTIFTWLLWVLIKFCMAFQQVGENSLFWKCGIRMALTTQTSPTEISNFIFFASVVVLKTF